MAMVASPKVLFLDEPTSGVSAEEKFDIMDRVMEVVRSRNVTVLFVEHDMDIVQRYSERVLAFYSGRVLADGAAQAVPGPLFTLSAYLGAVMRPAPTGWAGAALALAAMFLPALLLVVGTLPFWDALRARPAFRAALRGINAAVVGLLLAALYDPVWTGAIHAPADFALALVAFGLLALWSAPPWLVVVLAAAGAQAIAWLR